MPLVGIKKSFFYSPGAHIQRKSLVCIELGRRRVNLTDGAFFSGELARQVIDLVLRHNDGAVVYISTVKFFSLVYHWPRLPFALNSVRHSPTATAS